MAPTPQERLRAFEDEKLGADAPRHAGHIEKGHGSLFQRLPAEHRSHHDALVALVAAHEAHAKAEGEVAAVASKLRDAEARAETTEAASVELHRKGKKVAAERAAAEAEAAEREKQADADRLVAALKRAQATEPKAEKQTEKQTEIESG